MTGFQSIASDGIIHDIVYCAFALNIILTILVKLCLMEYACGGCGLTGWPWMVGAHMGSSIPVIVYFMACSYAIHSNRAILSMVYEPWGGWIAL